MTTLDPLTGPDALALCVAIDAGDDGALPLLADLLEEAGDGRAAGLRGNYSPQPGFHGWAWKKRRDGLPQREPGGCWVSARTFQRLPGALGAQSEHDQLAYFPTRSAAFLALAEALA